MHSPHSARQRANSERTKERTKGGKKERTTTTTTKRKTQRRSTDAAPTNNNATQERANERSERSEAKRSERTNERTNEAKRSHSKESRRRQRRTTDRTTSLTLLGFIGEIIHFPSPFFHSHHSRHSLTHSPPPTHSNHSLSLHWAWEGELSPPRQRTAQRQQPPNSAAHSGGDVSCPDISYVSDSFGF